MPSHPATDTESKRGGAIAPGSSHSLDAAGPDGQDHPFREYRAPREHGQAFVEPGFAEAGSLLRDNLGVISRHGGLLADLRQRARRQLIDSACDYTGSYLDVSWVNRAQPSPIIMAGHQPALFHPGVWFKNFALSYLAQQTDSLAINLVVDNDVAASSTIRVPTIDPDTRQTRYTAVAYDHAGGGVPYEQTTIRDRECFDHFDQRVAEAIRPIVSDPCVDRLWVHAKAAVARCGVAGCALAQSRHALESEIGLKTLEVPLGVLCRSTAFAEFVLTILTELPRFRGCYNDAADRYRAVHGIRSNAHPVPNLAEEGEWFEAPLWIYGDDSPSRRAAWVRLSNDELIISDRMDSDSAAGQSHPRADHRHGATEVRIDIRHRKLAAEQLAAAASPRFKLRPRALFTTMYARLVLSDLFLHGIGGAKYDQLGDIIIRSFFAVEPPQFMVISATAKLPGIVQDDHAEEIRRLRRQLRDTRFQGERFADQVDLNADLLALKRELLAHPPDRGSRKAWHDEIERINRSLSDSLQDVRSQLGQQLAQRQKEAASAAVLSSREHPFCLFPLAYLTTTFDALLSGSSAANVSGYQQ